MVERLLGLDQVDWASLIHAYGPATDVPDQIRALASADDVAREGARLHLSSNIFHQGTRYQATSHAVPFLFEIIRHLRSPERGKIVHFLSLLAIGYDEEFIPNGLNPAKFREQRRGSHAAMSPDERAECDEYGCSPLVEIECYDAVRRGVALVASFLDSFDRDLRCTSAHFLAWFPERSAEIVPGLQAMLARATEPLEQAHAILALGLVARNSETSFDRETLLPYSEKPHSLLVRCSAAIAHCNNGPSGRSRETLIEAITHAGELGAQSKNLLFKSGHVIGYAVRVLRQGPADQPERIVAAFCRALEHVDDFQSCDVTRALLDLVVGDAPNRRGFFKGRPSSKLTLLQREALHGILRHGRWRITLWNLAKLGSDNGNYAMLLSSYGLPSSQAKLQAYLES